MNGELHRLGSEYRRAMSERAVDTVEHLTLSVQVSVGQWLRSSDAAAILNASSTRASGETRWHHD